MPCESMVFRWIFLLLVIISSVVAEEDLYKVLGVKRTATAKEIKSAYRRKALDTHPDKRKDIPKEQAAEEFQKVVHAFEILSDANSRKNYDQFGNSSGRKQPLQWEQFFKAAHFKTGRRTFSFSQFSPKNRFDVREAQSRVMHVVSLEQLKTVMLDDNDLLERNLLICFVTANEVETIADDGILYPYPFAGYSSQKIWWEDLLQTVKVRFHKENDLTRFFGLDGNQIRSRMQPIFIFGKRGQPLTPDLIRLQTSNKSRYTKWVWERLEVRVSFKNEHSHPVELFWIHQTSAKLSAIIKPGESSHHNTMLSHEWWARDARVDTRPDSPGRHSMTKNSCIGSWKILSDTPDQVILIKKKTCIDMSGHCQFWLRQGECTKNPKFMREECSLTCAFCEQDKEGDGKKRNGEGKQETGNHDEF